MPLNVHGSSFDVFSVDFQEIFAHRIHTPASEIYAKLSSYLSFTYSQKTME